MVCFEPRARIGALVDRRRRTRPSRVSVAADRQANRFKHSIPLSGECQPNSPCTLTLTDLGNSAAGYQVVSRSYRPASVEGTPGGGSLSIDVAYDRTELPAGESVTASVTLGNRGSQPAPMVVAELPIPAGFALDADGLSDAVEDGTIERFQQSAETTTVYLRGLEPGGWAELHYRLRALTPARVSVPAAAAYEYYNPHLSGRSAPATLTVEQP